MESRELIEEVHFSGKSGAMVLSTAYKPMTPKDRKQLAETRPKEDFNYGDIAMWGSNNKLPQEMMADVEKTGVLWAGVDAKTRIAVGKGPMPAKIVGFEKDGTEILEFVTDGEILDWLEMNNAFENSYGVIKDLYSVGNAWCQALFNGDRSYMMGYKRVDALECRFEKWKNGRINNVLMSTDWDRYNAANEDEDGYVRKVPLLDSSYPLLDLQSRSSGNLFMIAMQPPLSGRKYYAPSPWYSAYKWVKIAQGVPEMKAAMFNNQMNIKYIIEIHPDFWGLFDPKYNQGEVSQQIAIRKKFYDDIDKYLVGGENSYKSIYAPMKANPATGVIESMLKITPIDDKIKDGKLLPDSAAANIEILLPLMINSAVFGVDMPGGDAYSGGAGSGSNIREGYLVQVMLVELERRMNSRVFNVAKHVNGWVKKGDTHQLVLRYPNQILTTLNTGANTKPTA